MALFVQPSLKTVHAYLKVSVKNSVKNELSSCKKENGK